MLKTYQVPEKNLGTLEAKIAKLAKRCLRAGIAAPVLAVGTCTEVKLAPDEITGLSKIRRVYEVTLDSPERPKIEGYEFIATLSPVTDESGHTLGNVLRAVPGQEVPAHFRNATNYCDHCKTERRRNETFIIASADGYRQIGRNCLANYLGLGDPHGIAELAEILIAAGELCGMAEEDDGFGFGGSLYHERFDMEEVLTYGACCIRLYGWLSRKSAEEFFKTSTAARTQLWMFGTQKAREEFEHKLIPNEADKNLACETIEWLGTLGQPTDDYLYNLSLLAQAVTITKKNMGIAISGINAYSRAKEREIRRNAQIESDANSQFIGDVGERMDFTAVVLYVTTFSNDFGTTFFYKMKQGDNVLVYFASNDMQWEQGQTIAFKATIKKHDVRDGVNQTVVTRAKLKGYEMSKDEKKAVRKLNHVAKYVWEFGFRPDVIDDLIAKFQTGKFAVESKEESPAQ